MRSVKRFCAVVGEWARERMWWAGWVGVDVMFCVGRIGDLAEV